MITYKPPMGFNTWNTFGHSVNEEIVLACAQALIDSGLKDCGYDTVVIDDDWLCSQRDSMGRQCPDPKKFPHGMRYVADRVHELGLRFGIYSDSGMLTCSGFPGSFEHEWQDARTFAEWQIDYLKYDYCFRPTTIPPEVLYRRMSLALKNSGRDIIFSACTAGRNNTMRWVKNSGANLWRTTNDIFDCWKLLKELSLKAMDSVKHDAVNHFADMDMLIVGMNGSGNVGMNGCTEDEYRLHFSLWALLGSPLMIGCDIRDMNEQTRSILMNKRVIEINQDAAHNQPFLINSRSEVSPDMPVRVIAKILENGDVAIGIFNLSDNRMRRWFISIPLDIIGLPESTEKTLELHDLWSDECVRVRDGEYNLELEPHCCRLFRAKIINK